MLRYDFEVESDDEQEMPNIRLLVKLMRAMEAYQQVGCKVVRKDCSQ